MTGGIIKSLLPWPLRLLVGAKEAALSLARLAGQYPWQAALIVSLCLSGWLWRGKAKAIEQRDAWHLAFDKQKAAYIAAQKEAEAKQKAADQSNIAGQLAAIKQQDAAHVQLEAARRDAVSEFIAAGQLRTQAACRSPGGAGAAPLRDNPRPPADGQAPGDLVAVRPEQIEAWSEIELQNTERGQFLRGLIDQGLAVPQSALPEPAFGQ